MIVNELLNLDPTAWTEILQTMPNPQAVSVTAVEATPLSDTQTRFLLTLDGHSERIPFLGKQTNRTEAQFYRDMGSQLGFLTPRCLYSHVKGRKGLVILDDVPDHRPPIHWSAKEVERIIGNLASLHIAFWEQGEKLAQYRWLTHHIKPIHPEDALAFAVSEPTYWQRRKHTGYLSPQAKERAGSLLPAFEQATLALEILSQQNGWRNVIYRRHLDAIAEMLDDPMPILYPLRRLPTTLLHRNLASHHWHMTMFGDCTLLDWQMPALGPGVCDLVNFTEEFELLSSHDGAWQARDEWPLSVETMIDTYLLRLYDNLFPLFQAREIRQAIPAARCLFVLTHWLPRLVDLSKKRQNFAQWAGVETYLAGLFRRFYHAYKTL